MLVLLKVLGQCDLLPPDSPSNFGVSWGETLLVKGRMWTETFLFWGGESYFALQYSSSLTLLQICTFLRRSWFLTTVGYLSHLI